MLAITRRKWGMALVLAAGIGLVIGAAVAGIPDSSGEGIGAITLMTPTTPPGHDETAAEAGQVMVVVQGMVERRLVIWPLAEDALPQEVDRHVTSSLLRADPTGSQVLYSTENALMVLDLAARRASIVGELPPHSKITAAQWSPDGTAIAYVIETSEHGLAYYTRADGTQDARVIQRVTRGLPLDVAWLPTGYPVSIMMGVGPVGGLQATYYLYDPATGDQILLPPDTPTVQPWSPWRSPDGSVQLYPLAAWEESRIMGACKTGALGLTGPEWVYVELFAGNAKQVKTAFEIKWVFLDRVTWLDDGRILFRAMGNEACAPRKTGLYAAYLDHEPVQIVHTPAYAVSEDFDTLFWGISFATSPDQKTVAWAENDLATGISTVYRTPVDGGAHDILFQTDPPPDDVPFAYQDTEMILHLIWLP